MELIKQHLCKSLQKTYKDPFAGFASMDFGGQGKITLEGVLENMTV